MEQAIKEALEELKYQHSIGNHALNKYKEQNEKIIEMCRVNSNLFRYLGTEFTRL